MRRVGIITAFLPTRVFPTQSNETKIREPSLPFLVLGLIDCFSYSTGHQLSAQHTFRDCAGFEPNNVGETPVETGSGVTIMSFANRCNADHNVGVFLEPWIHSFSLVNMRSPIESRLDTCGISESHPITTPILDVSIPQQTDG